VSLQVPSSVNWLFELLVGDDWPQGDEDRLRELGRAWDAAAGDLDKLTPLLSDATGGVLTAIRGDAADDYRTFMTNLGQQIPGLVKSAQDLAGLSRQTALEVEYAKYMIIASLIVLAFEIASAIAAAVETFGASTAAVPAMETATQITVKMVLKKLIEQIIMGVIQQVGLDAAVQAIQMLKGDRTQWDWDKTKNAAITGAIGGAVGGALGAGMGKLAPKLEGNWLAEAVKGGVSGTVTSAIVDQVNGSNQTGWGSFTAGAIGGALEGAKGHRSTGSEQHVHDVGEVLGGDSTVPSPDDAPATATTEAAPDGGGSPAETTPTAPEATPPDPLSVVTTPTAADPLGINTTPVADPAQVVATTPSAAAAVDESPDAS
jgi:hypothetical protein